MTPLHGKLLLAAVAALSPYSFEGFPKPKPAKVFTHVDEGRLAKAEAKRQRKRQRKQAKRRGTK